MLSVFRWIPAGTEIPDGLCIVACATNPSYPVLLLKDIVTTLEDYGRGYANSSEHHVYLTNVLEMPVELRAHRMNMLFDRAVPVLNRTNADIKRIKAQNSLEV